ncbi:MAG: signal peptidase I [Kiritimatiellae bacterium]|nr:signal peptidase I [Kiritimatiellia bacterium]
MSLEYFIFPRLTRGFLVRLAILAAATWLIGMYWLRPMVVDGESMEPTYASHGVNVCVLTAYRSHPPARGDVVALRYGGMRYMLLKRVLAFAGETVSFSNGVCVVDGKPLDEPYVVKNSGWTVPPRTIRPGNIYVMGDNRSVPFENHVGGEISLRRVAGRTLW